MTGRSRRNLQIILILLFVFRVFLKPFPSEYGAEGANDCFAQEVDLGQSTKAVSVYRNQEAAQPDTNFTFEKYSVCMVRKFIRGR